MSISDLSKILDKGEKPMKNLSSIEIDYKEGDAVSVKNGVKDPDFGTDISGWRGIADSIYENREGKILVEIHWDSITLKNLEMSQLVECHKQGLCWDMMVLGAEEVRLSEIRDGEEDVERIKKKIQEKLSEIA